MDYLLIYDFAPGYLARRGAFREAHLALAWAAQAAGHLVLAGVLSNPADGAIFHFRCDSAAPVEAFAEADPYVQQGLVSRWQVREWVTAVGQAASSPVHPGAG